MMSQTATPFDTKVAPASRNSGRTNLTSVEAAALLAGYEPAEAGYLREYDGDAIKIERIKITIDRAIEAGDGRSLSGEAS